MPYVALMAAERGYADCVNYGQNKAIADTVVGQIESAGGRGNRAPADLSVEREVVGLFETISTQLGPLTALVNNVGVLERQMRVEEMTAERLNHIFAINITSAFLCAREAIWRMSTKHGGSGGWKQTP